MSPPTNLKDLILPYSFLLRLLQTTLAITIAGLYGVDLTHNHISVPASWIYVEVVAALSTLTAGLYIFGKLKHFLWTLWDFIICVLWAAQAGYFGTMFLGNTKLNEEAFVGEDDGRMKAGVWVGLVCMALWLASCVRGISAYVSKTKIEGKGKDGTEMVMEAGVYRHIAEERGRRETMLPTYEDVVMGGGKLEAGVKEEKGEKEEKGDTKIDR